MLFNIVELSRAICHFRRESVCIPRVFVAWRIAARGPTDGIRRAVGTAHSLTPGAFVMSLLSTSAMTALSLS